MAHPSERLYVELATDPHAPTSADLEGKYEEAVASADEGDYPWAFGAMQSTCALAIARVRQLENGVSEPASVAADEEEANG